MRPAAGISYPHSYMWRPSANPAPMTEKKDQKEAKDASSQASKDKPFPAPVQVAPSTSTKPKEDYFMSGALQNDDSYINIEYVFGPNAFTEGSKSEKGIPDDISSRKKTKRP